MHVLQPSVISSRDDGNEFGTLIFTWRGRVKRTKLLEYLPGWTRDIMYRLERGVCPWLEQKVGIGT
jgi:hypothetical protein